MKIYRLVILIGTLIFTSPALMAADVAANVVSTDIVAPRPIGVLMTTQFPAPQVYINMMPRIILPIPGYPKQTAKVDVFMTLTNQSSQTINYTFPSSQGFDIFIKNKYGAVVSQWSRGKVFLQVFTNISIPPGGSKTFGGSVDLTTADGQYIYPGNYSLSIELNNITRDRPDNVLNPVDRIGANTTNRSPSSQMPLRIDWAY